MDNLGDRINVPVPKKSKFSLHSQINISGQLGLSHFKIPSNKELTAHIAKLAKIFTSLLLLASCKVV